MRGFGTALWAVVSIGSCTAIGAGFLGGRALGAASLPAAAPAVPAASPVADLPSARTDRALRGLHSFDAGDLTDADPLDDPDRGVAGRLAATTAAHPPAVALIVVDASRAGAALEPFATAPFPVAFVVDARDAEAAATASRLRAAGRTVLAALDAGGRVPTGTSGIFGAAATAAAARAAVRRLAPGALVVDDATADGALFDAARRTGRKATARDVVVDALDGERPADFLFASALAIARRSGSAVVAMHARAETLRALGRFVERANRDGVTIVDVAQTAG